MTSTQLLQELKIRFNTEPKKYEKEDFKVLLNLLTSYNTLLIDFQDRIEELEEKVEELENQITEN